MEYLLTRSLFQNMMIYVRVRLYSPSQVFIVGDKRERLSRSHRHLSKHTAGYASFADSVFE